VIVKTVHVINLVLLMVANVIVNVNLVKKDVVQKNETPKTF
jgi:hypothetical protein